MLEGHTRDFMRDGRSHVAGGHTWSEVARVGGKMKVHVSVQIRTDVCNVCCVIFMLCYVILCYVMLCYILLHLHVLTPPKESCLTPLLHPCT